MYPAHLIHHQPSFTASKVVCPSCHRPYQMISRGSGCFPEHICPALPGPGQHPSVSHPLPRKPGKDRTGSPHESLMASSCSLFEQGPATPPPLPLFSCMHWEARACSPLPWSWVDLTSTIGSVNHPCEDRIQPRKRKSHTEVAFGFPNMTSVLRHLLYHEIIYPSNTQTGRARAWWSDFQSVVSPECALF